MKLLEAIGRVTRAAAAAAALALSVGAAGQEQGAAETPVAPVVQQAPAENEAQSVVARLPRSAQLIIVVDDAAALRQGGMWEVLRPLLGPTPELDKTWEGLAKDLGWEPGVAFDRLLGRRVVLVARGLPPDLWLAEEGEMERAEWALLSDISLETDRRLIKTLEIVPRDIVRGHQLLAIEGGRYKLALKQHRPTDGAEATSTAILGPAGAPGLLGDLLGAITEGTPAPMAGTAACDAIMGMGRAGAVALFRETGAAGEEWSDFVALSVRREGEGRWTAQLAVSDRSMRDDLLRVPVSTDGAFRAISRGALAAVVETRLPEAAADGDGAGSVLLWLLNRLGIPEELWRQFASRQAALVAAAEGDQGEGLRVALGIEVRDVAATAPLADRYLGAMCAAADPAAGPVAEFEGCAPGAVRVVPLRAPPGGLTVVGRERNLDVAWVFPRGGRGVGGEEASRAAGWWVLGAAPSSAAAGNGGAGELVRGLGAALVGEESGESGRWISHGVVRPAELVRKLLGEDGVTGDWPRAASAIVEVEWTLRVSDEGQIRGTVTIQGK